MRQERRRRFLLAAGAVLAAPRISRVQAQDGPAARRPWVEPGDCWTYRSANVFVASEEVHTMCVNFVNDSTILATSTRKSDGKEVDSTWTREWNAVSSYTGFIYRPSAGYFQFPLNIGQKFTFKFDVLRPRSDVVLLQLETSTEVLDWEEVEVPAGKFRALKIETTQIGRRSDGKQAGDRTIRFWYAPEVRRWVKFVSSGQNLQTISEELLEFKLK